MTSSFPPLPPDSTGPVGTPAELLDAVLNPLLEDFATSFRRGLELLATCPPAVLPLEAQQELRQRLQTAQAELSAANALRAAAPTPMALDMATITPWHELLVQVWSLSAAMRAHGSRP